MSGSEPYGPKASLLGFHGDTFPLVTKWADPIVTYPTLGATEVWEIWNWTPDAHPVHLHLVKFKVLYRKLFDKNQDTPGMPLLNVGEITPSPTENGWLDTFIAYPNQVTYIQANFDIAGLYVWHCHIVMHEDNEMMAPFCVGDPDTAPGCRSVP